MNSELWGRVTDVPWAFVFPNGGPLPRHPSQLYEFALEGVVLFFILNWFIGKPRPLGSVSGLFLAGYGTFRFLVEYVREPDAQLGLFGASFQWANPLLTYGDHRYFDDGLVLQARFVSRPCSSKIG